MEENKQQTDSNQAEETQGEKQETPERETPAFRGLKKQIAERDKQVAELQAQINEIRRREELGKLEAQGQWEEAKKTLAAENQQLRDQMLQIKAEYESEREQETLKMELVKAGVTHDYFLRGAMMDYATMEGEKPAISDFVKALKADKKNAALFGAAALKSPAGDTATAAAQPPADLAARLNSPDKAIRQAAITEAWKRSLQGKGE